MNKIAIDARMISSSGIGTVIQNILQRMILHRPDWTFYVISMPDAYEKYEYLRSENVVFIPAAVPIYSIKEQLVIPRLVPKDADLLWVPHYNIPIFHEGKMVVTVHDVFHLAMPEFVKGVHKKIYAKSMFNMVSKKAMHIICVSQFTAQELVKYVHVNRDKISVIYDGVDRFWRSSGNKGVAIYPRPYILYVGNVKPHKNIRRLVLAFQKVAGKIDYDLIIVGKKEGFITGDPVVAKLAGTMGNRIHFTGFISNEDLKNYYQHASLFVFPSLYEGFGLPPLEAAAAGCRQILCSDIPVLHEIYGDSVEYFDPYDIENLAEKILIGLKGTGTGKVVNFDQYNWETCTSEYEKIFANTMRPTRLT